MKYATLTAWLAAVPSETWTEYCLMEANVAEYKAALARSSFDISPCLVCGLAVVCLPDGMPMCDACAAKESEASHG